MSDPSNASIWRFMCLFEGLNTAFGTGRGQWIKRTPILADFRRHLRGESGMGGIGIAPLMPDNTVKFAAIDLDEPDFEAAREMQKYLPGPSFIERSRSGNAHVWVFFETPIEAWIAMGVLKVATEAAGKKHVEVFPKNHNFARVKLGNYINLPFHGDQRPILRFAEDDTGEEYVLEDFLDDAEANLNDPQGWQDRAIRVLNLEDPEKRRRESHAQFGEQTYLHSCAQHLLDTSEENPVTAGHRNNVFFMLAKCLTNCRQYDHDEAFDLMCGVNEDSPDPAPEDELLRILENVERGGYTSTGCDDPVVAPWTDPECKIAHG